MGAFVHVLRCADGRYYVGSTRGSLEKRIAEHNAGTFGGYTSARRPVTLMFQQHFPTIVDAVAMERRLKGWSRAKKESLMKGDVEALRRLARKRRAAAAPSFDTRAALATQDEALAGTAQATAAWRASRRRATSLRA